MRRIGILSGVLALVFCLFLYGALLYPHGGELPSAASLEPPSGDHWLGSDNLGIDIFAQISRGFFHSMTIGLSTALLAFLLGGVLGVCAGYLGGWADLAVEFLINVFLSVPQLPIMIVIGAFWGQSRLNIICIIAAFSWAPIAKQVRARTMSLRETDYLRLARSYGGGLWYLFRVHMSRDILPLLAVGGLGVVGRAIVQESSLAFLGLSDPLAKSWGLMIARCTGFRGIYFTPFWKWWLLPPVISLVVSAVLLRLLARALERYLLEEHAHERAP